MKEYNKIRKKNINPKHLLKIESTEIETKVAIKKILHEKILKTKSENNVKLIWTNKGRLLDLAEILYKRKFIKKRKDVFLLFQSPILNKKVKWNPLKKYHLAYFLYRLYIEKYIIVSGNKGYYRFAEDHFIDFNGLSFKKNSLKNLKLKIIHEKGKYSFVSKEIDEIIERI